MKKKNKKIRRDSICNDCQETYTRKDKYKRKTCSEYVPPFAE
jgi:hypothetical protein